MRALYACGGQEAPATDGSVTGIAAYGPGPWATDWGLSPAIRAHAKDAGWPERDAWVTDPCPAAQL